MSKPHALSIRQPGAELILSGLVTVDSRTWATTYRGRLWVHAGLQVDTRLRRLANAVGVHPPRVCPTGYLGYVDLIDVHGDVGCCWPWGEAGHYHWVLANPVRLAEPVPGLGFAGVYRVPEGALG